MCGEEGRKGVGGYTCGCVCGGGGRGGGGGVSCRRLLALLVVRRGQEVITDRGQETLPPQKTHTPHTHHTQTSPLKCRFELLFSVLIDISNVFIVFDFFFCVYVSCVFFFVVRLYFDSVFFLFLLLIFFIFS